ncbi:5-oxoprolinase subunit PxpA [Cellulophaga sp. E16_2]|uniref:5-oxoprolinase subunit PxpA n=1 Tax=unclassified Cellulophaga TaxID=2634405 RepID=UPI0013FD9787|nr:MULTISPECIES: 5-oxoprolinase subunit PxpA [unclassified Cellulophaga]MBO0593292.1 5-oxoprolinase subunit PxpA [Cellulophaga sp. E16_2]
MKIDINSDVGEGVGNEKELLPLISSCNIACGGHAGDENSIREVIKIAKKNKVLIGAHPSYPDKVNFGRKTIVLSKEILIQSLQKQLQLFFTVANQENVTVHHIKAHGALYNDSVRNVAVAHAFLEAIIPFSNTLKLYVPYNSILAQEAIKKGISVAYEAFLDRNYNDDGSLVSRTQENALIENPQEVLRHLLCMLEEGKIKTVHNKLINCSSDTFCIHGDTVSALKILMYLHNELPNYNIQINP